MKARALEAQRAREREIQLEIEVKAEHAKRLRQEEDEVRLIRQGRTLGRVAEDTIASKTT